MRRLRFPVFHPLLFSAYPVLALLTFNIKEVTAWVAVRPLLVSLAGAALLYALLGVWLKDWHKAALLTTLFSLLFFSYGQVYRLLEGRSVFGFWPGRHRYLAPLYLAVLASGAWLILSRLRRVAALTPFFNIAAMAALLLPLLQVGSFGVTSALADRQVRAAPGELSIDQEAELPDIYYIILDTYTRGDILATDYGFDNQPFLNELREMGFYVAACSMSNYASTELSLSTSLNMDYLEKLASEFERPEMLANNAQTSMPQLMRHSRVRSALEKIGYQTVAFETGYSWSSISDAASYLSPGGRDAPPGGLRLFELMLLENTAALPALDAFPSLLGDQAVGAYPYYNEHIERELFKLQELPEIPGLISPKFVFAHILIPHGPMVFAPDGAIRTDERFYQNEGQAVNEEFEREGYVGQTEYINSRIAPILQEIIARSATPPVIILQGDHGLGKMGILNAYYLPEVDAEAALYPSISPVNTFRVVFNAYFGTNYPLLEDKSFFSSADDRFHLRQVSETMEGCLP